MKDGKIFVGWTDIDCVRQNLQPILCLYGLHLGAFLYQLGQNADVGGVKMGNQDKSHAGVLRHVPENRLESLQPACRGAHANRVEAFWVTRGHGFLIVPDFCGGLSRRCFPLCYCFRLFFLLSHDEPLLREKARMPRSEARGSSLRLRRKQKNPYQPKAIQVDMGQILPSNVSPFPRLKKLTPGWNVGTIVQNENTRFCQLWKITSLYF